MAPKPREPFSVDSSNDRQQSQTEDDELPVRDSKSLTANEVSIDGVVYDISSFDHPGGDSISLFGGQDATIAYKMIHTYHHNKNYAAVHLSKMKQVGILPSYQPDYTFETPFALELKQEVFKVVNRQQQFATPGYWFRAIFFLSVFFFLHYLWIVQGSSVPLAIAYGVAAGWIGTSVQHDANHGAISKRPWVNELLGYMNDILGNPKILWQQQHWTHHAHTNDPTRDPDSAGAEPFLLFFNYPDKSDKRQWYHAYQVYYFVAVLSGFWAALFFSLDFWKLQKGSTGDLFRTDTVYIRKNYWISQLVHLYYRVTFVLPPFVYHGIASWQPWLHITIFAISVSLYLGMLFTLSHNFEGVKEGDVSKDNGNLTQPRDRNQQQKQPQQTSEPVDWYKRQVETSSTYGGFLSGCVTGGLNYQIEHHLFPRMSSAWYPYIAPTVRRVCKKHGVQYVHFPWIWQNMFSTFARVRDVGTGALWNENKLPGTASLATSTKKKKQS